MSLKICVSLTQKNKEAIAFELNTLNKYHYDILEWRIDYLENMSISNILTIGKQIQSYIQDKLLLLTIRSNKEGGFYQYNLDTKLKIYEALITHKIGDYIDVEIQELKKKHITTLKYIQTFHVQLVGSYHNFQCVPNATILNHIISKINVYLIDIVKIAIYPNSYTELYEFLKFIHQQSFSQETWFIAMGEIGNISRIAPNLFSSSICFTYVNRCSAQGQLSIDTISKLIDMKILK